MRGIMLKEILIERRKHSQSKLPSDVLEKLEQSMKEMRDSSNPYHPLKKGDTVQNFIVPDLFGNPVELYRELVKGPIVLVFYRGDWCPYCNLQLRAYQSIVDELAKYNTQLIAISPQLPDHSLTLEDKKAFPYKIVTDLEMKVAKQFKILLEIKGFVKVRYLTLDRDLSRLNGSGDWTLPVPSVFLINKEGSIVFSSVNADWRERLEPSDILNAVRSIPHSESMIIQK